MSMMKRDSNTCDHEPAHAHKHGNTQARFPFVIRGDPSSVVYRCAVLHVSHGRIRWITGLPDHVLFRSSTFFSKDSILCSMMRSEENVMTSLCWWQSCFAVACKPESRSGCVSLCVCVSSPVLLKTTTTLINNATCHGPGLYVFYSGEHCERVLFNSSPKNETRK